VVVAVEMALVVLVDIALTFLVKTLAVALRQNRRYR
jgi:hypothetical protein